MFTSTTARLGSITVLIFCLTVDTFAVVQLKGTAGARLDRGIATLDEDYLGGFPLPDNGSTGVHSVMNSHLFCGAISSASLASRSIGSAAGSIGGSNYPTDATSFRMVGGGSNIYSDELTVTSATLPAGTPVTIMFSFEVTFSMSATSSRGIGGGSNNSGLARLNISSNANSVSPISGNFDSFQLSSNDNNAIVYTDTGAVDAIGIFSGTQHVDVLLGAEVGGLINFNLATDADAVANVAPFFVVSDYENQTASAFSSVGIAFGASENVPRGTSDITIVSARLGAEFPQASEANTVNAAAGAPPSPQPPTPEGDFDGDGDVDCVDHQHAIDCLAGPNVPPAPTWPGVTDGDCLNAFDFNTDSDVDLEDIAEFELVYEGP